jgi:hypothetical protein
MSRWVNQYRLVPTNNDRDVRFAPRATSDVNGSGWDTEPTRGVTRPQSEAGATMRRRDDDASFVKRISADAISNGR